MYQIRREEPNLARRTLPLGRLLTLQEPEDAYELSRLADDVLEASSSSQGQGQGVGKRPEGWLLAGMYALCKDDGESALTLIDKVRVRACCAC